MRASLLQLCRLRSLPDTTIGLMNQAAEAVGGMDLHTEREIDMAWVQDYRALEPAFHQAVHRQYLADQRPARGHDADAAEDLAKAHLVGYLSLLRQALLAVAAPHEQAALTLVAGREEVKAAIFSAMGRSIREVN